MKTTDKNRFLLSFVVAIRIATKFFIYLILTMIIAAGCDEGIRTNDDNREEQQTPPEENGKEQHTHELVGEWDIVKFAYTADGNTILDVATIQFGTLTIPVAQTPVESNFDNQWMLKHVNMVLFDCTISENLIELTETYSSGYAWSPANYTDLVLALKNVYSFMVRCDELIFYFTGFDDKNLLILRKRPPDDLVSLISSNLSRNGNIDPAFLLGEWDCVKFAYTADGNTISEELSGLSKGRIRVNKLAERYNIFMFHTNTRNYKYAFNNNLRRHTDVPTYFTSNVNPPPQEEIDLDDVFRRMYSFVVRDDELIIYSARESKNLLILKKRTPSHELISSNLLKMGSAAPELLIGEWDCVKFAYTADGNTISDEIEVADKTRGQIKIYDATNLWMTAKYTTTLVHAPPVVREIHFDCSISDNLIVLSYSNKNYPLLFIPFEIIDTELEFALSNAYSFIMKGDELIIYFIGTDNGKNLLILKKR